MDRIINFLETLDPRKASGFTNDPESRRELLDYFYRTNVITDPAACLAAEVANKFGPGGQFGNDDSTKTAGTIPEVTTTAQKPWENCLPHTTGVPHNDKRSPRYFAKGEPIGDYISWKPENNLKPLLYRGHKYIKKQRANKLGNGGIYVVFPRYRVDTGLGFRFPLGHGMAIAVDDKTGATRGSEYGRYDAADKGIARRVTVPNLIAEDPSNPTQKELNHYAEQLNKMYGHSGGRVEIHYVRGADDKKMINLMESAEKNTPDSFYQNRDYNILDHNCGTYAADMIKQSMPWYKFSGFGPYSWGTPAGVAPYWGTEGNYDEKYGSQIILR